MRTGFLHNVERLPQHAALRVGARVYTYGEVAETAGRWAARLVDAAGGRPRRVGVLAYRNEASYLGVLASVLAGAAFVPLNRRFPLERTRAMLEQADVDALIVDAESAPDLGELLRGLPRPPAILLPATGADAARGALPGRVFGREDLAAAAPLATLPELTGDDPAYLLFTSGSSGTPKGVPITQANVRAFLDFNLARYGLTPEDRLTQTFDQTFDLSVFDLFMAWESGACVCSMQPLELLAPARFLEQHQVTVWFSVPSIAALLMKRRALLPGSMPTLRWSLFCGEALPRAMAEAWLAAAPRSTLENLYGPTELTIACTAYRWDPATSPAECVHDLVPIGEVYAGLSHLVVDDALGDVADGEAGELCVAGPQTSPGYWRDPALSAARFFERTGPDGATRRYYRTGDLVARRGGSYVYLGRTDQQIRDRRAPHRAGRDRGGPPSRRLRRGGRAAVAGRAEPRLHRRRRLGGRRFLRARRRRCALPAELHAAALRPCRGRHAAQRQREDRSRGAAPMGQGQARTGRARVVSGVAVEPIVARVLGIDVARVTDDLTYQSIPEWDSFRHVALMLALEEALGVPITDELTLSLHSLAAIREFAGAPAGAAAPAAREAEPAAVEVHRGLAGVHVDRTRITRIDGENGVLEHRGYSIHDLVERSSFEEMALLLISGDLPEAAQLGAFEAELRSCRALPEPVVGIVRALAHAHPMEVLRTGVSALGAFAPDARDESPEAALRAGVRLIAQIPTLIAAHHAIRSGREPIDPLPAGSHAHNLLYMLSGQEPSPAAARFVDMDLMVHADHSSNASAFAARVVIGCQANLHAAVTAAIAAFSGALHGGAAERVIDLIDEVGTPERAAAYVRERLSANQPVMGFGHRVYRTEDPRVRHLRAAARELSRERGDERGLAIIEAIIAAMEPYARHGIGPNVDLYAGLAYRLLGLPDDLSVPMFVAGRIAGWVAQALEQRSNNVLIRPLLHYVGPTGRAYRPPAARRSGDPR
ncbi:MAG: citrate/2-methylcitrate synthase [Minicystis sp.]